MKNQFNVLIIGAGNIGAFFDTPKSENILTHAHAFSKHKDFNLLGFVDIDKEKAKKAILVWGGKVFSSIKEAFSKEKIDIATIAVPDKVHYRILKKVSQFPVKLVFAEKPLTKTLTEANEIIRLYKKKKIPVVVNYSRRFVPEFGKIKKNISNGLYGDYITGTGYYGKGLLHNGSHLIDLLRWLIGEIKDFKVIKTLFDFYNDDPSVSAVLRFKNKRPFFLQFVDCNLFTIFEVDLLFEKKRILIKDSGLKIEEHGIKEDPVFKGYKNMLKTREINTSLSSSIYYAVENIYNFLTKGEDLKCGLKDGYRAVEICTNIIDKIKGKE